MNLPFEVQIAFRYLTKKKGHFVTISSILAIIGISIGVSSLILATGLTNGFNDAVQSKILGIETAVSMTRSGGGLMTANNKLMDKIRAVSGVKAAYVTLTSGGILSSPTQFGSVVFEGVKRNFVNSRLKKHMQKGDFEKNAILIGAPLLKLFKLHIGDTVKLIIPFGQSSPFGLLPKTVNLKISGVFQTGLYQYDHVFIFMPLSTARNIMGVSNMLSSIDIAISDPYKAELFAKNLATLFPSKHIVSWISQNANLFYAMKLQKIIVSIVLSLILLVSSFAISSSLIMLVTEKKSDIAILRSMGAKKSQIKAIFVSEGLMISSIGIIVGIILSLIMAYLMGHYQFIKLPRGIFYLNTIPLKLSISDVTVVSAIAVAISLFSTLYPAGKAAGYGIDSEIRQ